MSIMPERAALEARWLELTRRVLPTLAAARRFPVCHDHCFQRILLDAVCGGRWSDQVRRPAYRLLEVDRLVEAVRLAEAVVYGSADLHALNRRSLDWRKQVSDPPPDGDPLFQAARNTPNVALCARHVTVPNRLWGRAIHARLYDDGDNGSGGDGPVGL